MIIAKRIIILLIFAFLFQNVYSQRYFTKSYDIENGLPSRMVFDICQDSSGLIWLATYEGLCCYDGFKFLKYNVKDGLPDQKFKHLLYDDKGSLWGLPLNLHDTVIYYKDNVFKRIEPFNKGNGFIKTNDFDIIYFDNVPVICVGTDDGLYVFKDNTWNKITVSDNPLKNKITRIIRNKDKFFFSTSEGIYILDANNLKWSFDDNLESYCIKNCIIYTRYSDDIFLSSRKAQV